MAPKKATDRVVKTKAKPRQSAAAAQAAGRADEELHLIYLCLKSNGGSQIDYQAVADALGITKNAAKQRYYKIRNLFEGVSSPGKSKGQTEEHEIKEEENHLLMKKEEEDGDLKMKTDDSEDEAEDI